MLGMNLDDIPATTVVLPATLSVWVQKVSFSSNIRPRYLTDLAETMFSLQTAALNDWEVPLSDENNHFGLLCCKLESVLVQPITHSSGHLHNSPLCLNLSSCDNDCHIIGKSS